MWYNPLITFLLRSPLHPFVSGLYLLITFTGQKTGRTYTTPVQYQQSGSTLKFVTRRSRAWWRNLRGGAAVALRLRGQERHGVAEVLPAEGAALAAEIQQVYAPYMNATMAAKLAPDSVVIQITLAD